MENIIVFRNIKNNPPKVTELLRLYRVRSRLTQKELANRLTLQSDRMIRKWEAGQSLPEPARLKRLIEVYLRSGVFTGGQELQEAQNLWQAVKATFEFQSPSFELFIIFDTAWFESLLSELSSTSTFSADMLQDKAGLRPGSPSAVTNNLPVPLTSLIGRENEIKEIKTILASNRLLMLTGPAGVGKTRLALEIGLFLANSFKDGVRLVRLDTISNTESLTQAMANSIIGNEEGSGWTTEKLINFLRPKELLVVLDACDTVVSEVGIFLDQLLKKCPYVSVLATSRENLGIGGEALYQVGPLSIAGIGLENEASDSLDRDNSSTSVRLFIERASAVQPTFNLEVTQLDKLTIGRICRQLDGLPLAIELAAYLMEGVNLEQLESRLADNPFPLLRIRKSTGTGVLNVDRQNSLESSFDWGYTRLNPAEQLLLHHLSLLSNSGAGPLSLETIKQFYHSQEAANNTKPNTDTKTYLLDMIYSLVNKSLVNVSFDESDGKVSFSLLETVKKYIRNQKFWGNNLEQFSL